MEKTRLIITTPEGIFFDDMVNIVTIKTIAGQMGFMANHQPTISAIEISHLLINELKSPDHKWCAVEDGMIFVEKKQINIVTSGAVFSTDIDVELVKSIKQDAEIYIKNNDDKKNNIKILEQQLILKKALNQISILDKK